MFLHEFQAQNKYELDLSNEVLYVHLDQMTANLQACKVCNQKNVETFWVRGYVFRKIAIVNLVFGQPGFDSRTAQTLKACNFAALWSGKTYSTSFERSKLCLLG